MRLLFRVLVVSLALACLVYAILVSPNAPASPEQETARQSETPPAGSATPEVASEPTPTPLGPAASAARNILGGAQIDAGKKAQGILQEVDEDRKQKLDELTP